MDEKYILLAETRSLKVKLQQDIFKLLNEFKKQTTLTVTNIDLTHAHVKNDPMSLFDVEVEVKL
jgi:ABC-type dipeptide/oligopeptide/nickel transport system ATPase subunit